MAKEYGIYKCQVCGNVVSVIEAHAGTLVCCNQDMKLLETMTSVQEGKEKHVPVIEIGENKVTVKVGSVNHPMEDKHWIEFIQLLQDDKVIGEKKLYPGDKPIAEFLISDTRNLKARELCNLHGLWTT